LEVEHGEWLDTRGAGAAGGADPEKATVGAEHRIQKVQKAEPHPRVMLEKADQNR